MKKVNIKEAIKDRINQIKSVRFARLLKSKSNDAQTITIKFYFLPDKETL